MLTDAIGLIAGSGRLPFLFAEAARAKGLSVHAVGHRAETDEDLSAVVSSLDWVRVGQVDAIVRHFKRHHVTQAVMAGGIGRVRSLTQARPDLGALRIAAAVRSMRDDELLRGVAGYFERAGIRIAAPTDFVPEVLAGVGHLAGPPLTDVQRRDVELGQSVAAQLGRADVGQTVVVKEGVVLAVEAVEGTDEAIRRGGRYGGPGAVVVKRSKPTQDLRFDLPAIGPDTLEVMREAGVKALVIEARTTVLLDAALVLKWAARMNLSIVSVAR